MNIVTEIKEWQAIRTRLGNQTIGFVPTMGNLHAGHLSLCARAKADNEITVVSIFINPTQFNQPQDFTSYPRTLEQDIIMLDSNGIDFLIHPNTENMYPDNYQLQVSETAESLILEGAYRPGHFNGVLTIVLKLLHLVQPTHAYFGEKDYQQLLLIRKMAASLFLPAKIVACPTIRGTGALALSSRNSRLSPQQYEKALKFPQLLHSALNTAKIAEELITLGFKVDYITERWQRRLGAVWIDDIRLIDNIPNDLV